MSIYSPAEISPFMNGLPFTLTDPQIQSLIDAVESQIQLVTGLRFAETTIIEFARGRWCPTLVLRYYPIRSVESVIVWPITSDNPNYGGQNPDADDPPDALEPGVDYWLTYDKILPDDVELSMAGILNNATQWTGSVERKRGRLGYRKIPGPQNIEIEYEAGFPDGDVPPEFLACVAAGVKMAAIAIEAGGRFGTSQSLDGWSESWEAAGGRLNPPIPGMAGIIGSTLGMIAAWIRPRILGG